MISLAPETTAPRPSPGYSSALSPCLIVQMTPLYSTSSTGMPAVTKALPPDQAVTSAGMASMRSVGFDNSNTMGRSAPVHNASVTS